MQTSQSVRFLVLCAVFIGLSVTAIGISTAQSGAWTSLAPMPRVRAQHGLAAVNGRLYAVGGGRAACQGGPACYATETAEYDPATGTWTDRASTFTRKNHATVAVGDRVYVIGGDDDFVRYASAQSYHPATDSWSLLQSMPTPRTILGAAAVDGVIYALGGLTGTAGATGGSVAVDKNEAYEIGTNTWSVKAPMPTTRYGVSVAALDGLVYALGGSAQSGAILNVVEVYDPATNTWSTRAPLPDLRSTFATVAHDGRLYVIGGHTPGIGTLSSVLIYDPSTDSWLYAPGMNTARGLHAAAVLNGTVYASGGMQVSSGGQGLAYFSSFESATDLQPLVPQPAPPPPPSPTNHAPFANAGGPYTADVGSSITLDASTSSDGDPGDSVVEYAWTINGMLKLSGPSVTLGSAETSALGVGTHNVSLTVADEAGLTATSTTTLTLRAALVSISVSPSSATLNVGENRTFQAIAHYSDGTTRVLPSAGGGGAIDGPNRPMWSVQFPSQMDVSVCDGSTDPRTTFSGQGFTDVDGVISETWSPGTPVLDVAGTIDANSVSLTLQCKNGGAIGSIQAQWAGTRYLGTYDFAGRSGAVDITGWSQHASMPQPRFALAAATVNGVVYALGGSNPSQPSAVFAYNPSTESWTAVGQLPTSREGLGAAAIDGRIYAVGGNVSVPGNAVPSGVLEAYEPATNSWFTLQSMPTARAHLAVVTDGTYLYAIGGETSIGNAVATVERYNPATNTWTSLTEMPMPGRFIAGGVLDGTIVIVGAGGNDGASDATYIYNIASGQWRSGPRMLLPRSAAAAAVANGGLYVFGGSGPSYVTLVYYPPVESPFVSRPEYWSTTASIPYSRAQAAAAVVGDVVYVLGGLSGSDPSTETDTNQSFSTPPVNTFAPANGGGSGDSLPTVQWQLSNPSVASIDGMGNVRANSAGTTSVVATASNGMSCATSNTCATVTVAGDTQPPMLSLPNDQVREAQNSSGAVVGYFASAFDQTDGPRPIFCSPQSNSVFPIGTTRVTCTATDSSGNVATGGFNVTVQDTQAPFLSTPNNQTREAQNPSGATVTWFASAFDNVSGQLTPSCNPPSGSVFPKGTTTVTCTAVDSSGNVATRSFTVTVQDTQAPFLGLPGSVTREATGPSGAVVTFNASANDSVDGQRPVTCSPPSGSTFGFGTTTVNCSASDTSGNTRNGSFAVTVRDTTAPFIGLPSGITEQAEDTSGAEISFFVSAFDSVDGPRPVSCSPASGSLFSVGTTTVQCSTSDTRGNTRFGSFTVTITPPPTPAEMTSRLLQDTAGLGFESAEELLTSVIDRNPPRDSGDTASCGKLGAFINQAQAQRGKKIPEDRAAIWIDYTGRIRKAIGCR